MSRANRVPRSLSRLIPLAVACVLGASAAGCLSGDGTLSPADQTKAKEAAKKKFDNLGAEQSRKPSG